MRLLWISGRNLKEDLAGTTEISLCNELERIGCQVTFISPGEKSNEEFRHVPISVFDFPGLVTLSGARRIKKILKEINTLDFDISIIDWRYAYSLRKEIESLEIPWCIVDRGPPASSGIIGGRIRRELLRNLQKKFWKMGWKIAQKSASSGFVVSKNHGSLVKDLTGDLEINILPAGSYANPREKRKCNPREILKLCYVGRVDRKRGIDAIVDLKRELDNRRINHEITISGEGDSVEILRKKMTGADSVIITGKISRREVESMLSEQHVGIMPMPDIAIWRIASPLKLAEYLSAGMAIIGPKHPGNTTNSEGKWSMLSESNPWVVGSVDKIEERLLEDWREVENSAMMSSDEFTWEKISLSFYQKLQKIVDSTESLPESNRTSLHR